MGALKQLVKDKLSSKFGAALFAVEDHYDFPVFYIQTDKVFDILQFLYNDTELEFKFLTTMCAMHYPDKVDQELGVMYQLHNLEKNWRIRLKTFFPIAQPEIASITSIYATANWMEREAFDFYGVIFKGHPNLTRILNMDEMNYHPLRKEYPLEDGLRTDKNDTMFGR
jgi:NADH-quinone oxidoreductase subunit C